jgi:hypothetical protein
MMMNKYTFFKRFAEEANRVDFSGEMNDALIEMFDKLAVEFDILSLDELRYKSWLEIADFCKEKEKEDA